MYKKHKSNTKGQQRFTQIPSANIPRSSFDRSCGRKTTFAAGELVPIFVDEVLPGDTMSVNMATFTRMATPIVPVMDNQRINYAFWFVPLRLLWSNFEKFMGAQDNPGDSTDFEIPQMTSPAGGYDDGDLQDHLGIPIQVEGLAHSALFTRAYAKIFNEWYRDENLVDSIPMDMDDGPDDPADYVIQKRAKPKDYFTSSLPWPQKGPAVSLPLGDSAPIVVTGDGKPLIDYGAETGKMMGVGDISHATHGGSGMFAEGGNSGTGTEDVAWNDPKLEADLEGATASTINELRQAFQIQKLFERDARGGTRYPEKILSHFGVRSADERVQRPEYLGGGQTTLTTVPVSTTATIGSDAIGDLGGFTTAAGSGIGFNKSFTEHGIVIGLCATQADLTYQQGLNRMFSRKFIHDFYFPALAHIGEQAVLNKEIYAQGTDDLVADEAVWGYQERFSEYRYKPSETAGEMRSTAALPLDQWHLAQDFAALPVLNASFIEEDPPIERVLAVDTDTNFLMDCFFKIRHVRPMPTYSVPGLIDHF